ncbi:MAG: hypothetical protein M5T61_16910 [Acidimicrobiia bacterium]|nr:hypothetical protein [Acidimicrobiia bacterium]
MALELLGDQWSTCRRGASQLEPPTGQHPSEATIRVTARPSSAKWTFGDGTTLSCGLARAVVT